jgi:hypothetical protein
VAKAAEEDEGARRSERGGADHDERGKKEGDQF